jgi:hypothetical protein
MGMQTQTIESLLQEDVQAAWTTLRDELKELMCEPITGSIVEEIIRREKRCEPLELALSGAAWSLWTDYYDSVPLASQRLIDWWQAGHGGKAVFILDGLSLREVPVLLEQAKERGFAVNEFEVLGSELPAETNAFARALGFSHRGSLDNNGAGGSHKMAGAFTLTNELPWSDVKQSIPAEQKLFVWHQWPDKRIHDLSDQGDGIRRLLPEVVEQLASDDFWGLVEKLATGREVVITSDHGYANTGGFRDADNDEKAFFKENFGGYRYKQTELTNQEWLPPLALTLDCPTGRFSMALGRTKWAVQGGNRTLSHGGLTLMETLVPFVRLNKN